MQRLTDWDSRIGRRVRLRDLHIFLTVVQTGGMAKAATHLGMSQPAVSEAVADLEATLKVRLLDRSRRGTEPTACGASLLKYGRAAFDELRQGIKEIEFLSDPTMGEVRIACPEIMMAGFLVPTMERFGRQFPKVVLRVTAVTTPTLEYPELHERRVDLTIARLARLPVDGKLTDALQAETLFTDRLCLAVGPRSPWYRRRKVDLSELINEPWVLPPEDYPGTIALFDWLHEHGLESPRFNIVTNSVYLRSHLGSQGHVTVLTESVVRLDAKKFGLKALPVEAPLPQWAVGIVWLAHRPMNPTAKLFIECARNIARSIYGKKVPLGNSARATRALMSPKVS